MAPSTEASPSSIHESCWTEIPGDELRRHQAELLAMLETVCLSSIFRNSPKSCEFIRHVALRTLEGNVDELKERLIGMSLLGRDARYDTSTDAGVRVRANDVRKRLAKFNQTQGAELDFSITLPTGSYIPRFFRLNALRLHGAVTVNPVSELEEPTEDALKHLPIDPVSQLSLFQLAAPTLVAIFLCIICMRWQLSQENSYTNFWQRILQGDQALLYLTTSRADGKQGFVAIQELNDDAAPLLDLAGQFHRQLTVMSSPNPHSDSSRMILHVGLNATNDLRSTVPGDNREVGERFLLVSSANDRVIIDRRNPARVASRHAALLTIINGRQRSIYIDGTDAEAIRSFVNRLCDEKTFPGSLADSLRPGTITQAVFPSEDYAKGILDREFLTGGRPAAEYTP
ncbi:MAG TPA: hypothetical protein VK638_34240 [Edaphobacter sp.]|nr:hypothetical protein [Edaphobacter sp.]